MPRKAEIKLTANIQEFQQNIDTAKKLLYGVGKTEIDPAFKKQLQDQLQKGLVDSIEKGEKKLASLQGHLRRLGQQMGGAPPKVLTAYAKTTADTAQNLEKSKKLLEEMSRIKAPTGGGGGAGSGGGMGGIGRMVTGGLATFGIGLGVGAAYQKMKAMTQERVGIASLTGGSQVNDQGGTMGFTPQERRQRALDVAKAIGRDVSSEDLDRITGIGEKAERAFGVSSGQSAGLMGAGRKAGVQNQAKFMSENLAQAMVSGLTGSRVGEYLEAMSSSLSSMSEGITLDTGSIRQFAGALIASGGVFARDPRNAFRIIQGLNSAFQGGDRFQQAQAARAVMGAAGPGTTPAGVEVRRSLGLFGNITDPETIARIKSLPGGEAAAKVLGTPGMDVRDKFGNIKEKGILGEMFEQAQTATKDQGAQERIGEIMERLNLRGTAGVKVATEVAHMGRNAMVDKGTLEKATLTEAQQQSRLQERLNTTYKGTNKSMLDLVTSIERLKETLAENIAPKIADLANALLGRKTQAEGKDLKSIYDEDAGFFEPLANPIDKAIMMVKSLQMLFTGQLKPKAATDGFNMIQDAEGRAAGTAAGSVKLDTLSLEEKISTLTSGVLGLDGTMKKKPKGGKQVKGEIENTGMAVQ